MNNINSEEYWPFFKSKLVQITDFSFNKYSDNFIRRKVDARLYALNLDSYLSYLNLLNKAPDERELLIKELTVPVTGFFRDKNAFDVFIAETMMELLSHKEATHNKIIRVWSAGCASGEEAYSLAITIYELLQQRVREFLISILGTDISSEMINKAQNGVFKPEHVKEMPEEYLSKYFTYNNNLFVINNEIKKLVRFEVNDILRMQKPKNLDIIFCRNVVIYFNKIEKEQLYLDFYNCLNNHGFFIMGMTEMIAGPARDLFCAYNTKYRIYQREEP